MTPIIKVDRVKSVSEFKILLNCGVGTMCLDCEGSLSDDRSLSIEKCLEILDECKSDALGIKINPSAKLKAREFGTLIDYARYSFLQIDYNYLNADWFDMHLSNFNRSQIYVDGVSIDCDENVDYVEKEILISDELDVKNYIVGLYGEIDLDWSWPANQTSLCETPWQELMALISKYDLIVQSDFKNYSVSNPSYSLRRLNFKLGGCVTASQVEIDYIVDFLNEISE